MNYGNSKIAIILGTRAELIKTFPVMLELQKRKISYYFLHTGQHNLRDLCEKFGVKKPDKILSLEPTKTSKFDSKNIKAIMWNLGLILKIKKELRNIKNLKNEGEYEFSRRQLEDLEILVNKIQNNPTIRTKAN